MALLEEKLLYKVLCKIGTTEEYAIAPDKDYIIALERIGLIKIGWDNELTDFGKNTKDYLGDKIHNW